LKDKLFDTCLNTSLQDLGPITLSQSHILGNYNVLGTELRYTAVNKLITKITFQRKPEKVTQICSNFAFKATKYLFSGAGSKHDGAGAVISAPIWSEPKPEPGGAGLKIFGAGAGVGAEIWLRPQSREML
jgi:hypothetical protein